LPLVPSAALHPLTRISAPLEVPCRRAKIRRNIAELFLAVTLNQFSIPQNLTYFFHIDVALKVICQQFIRLIFALIAVR